jgi:hypothetical protein
VTLDHAKARCSACVWARQRAIAVSDGFQHSSEVRHFAGTFCHVSRPALQVDPDSFCPDFEAVPKPATTPWHI